MMTPAHPRAEEARFRAIFLRAHADHPDCQDDEWASRPCRRADGGEERPLVWSRRNGAWRRADILWVGAAPGNAGGKGSGALGAHATRIPFGGDVAGANLDALLGSIGLSRNDTFVVAALNRLPDAGGGEPTATELAEPVGGYPDSLHLLRDTLLAVGPRLVVALGNVAVRCSAAAAALAGAAAWEREEPSAPRRSRVTGEATAAVGNGTRLRLPGLTRLRRSSIERGAPSPWPRDPAPSHDTVAAWRRAWGDAPFPDLLWLTHPSAQNMSPFAGRETAFHGRMVEARDALRSAVRDVLGSRPPETRSPPPDGGIYALPEWRDRVGPRHRELDRLWRAKGV